MSGPRDWPEGWSRDSAARTGTADGDAERTQVIPPVDGRSDRRTPEEKPPQRGAHPPPPFQRPRRRGVDARRWTRWALVALLVVVALVVATLLFFYTRIDKVDALQDYPGRPAAGAGTNWLVVGSDSREGLSDQQVKDLHLGKARLAVSKEKT